jgi:hypothetical protein
MNEDCMTILWLRSLLTGRRFPTVLFSGDTDMATSGLASLSSITGPEVVVTHLTGKEVAVDEYTAPRNLEERINATLGRSDFRCVPLVRSVEHKTKPSISFQEFRASYRPPDLFYRDILAPDGEAIVDGQEILAEFRAAGGIVVDATNLA